MTSANEPQTYPIAATKPQTVGRTANYGPRPDRPIDTPAFTVVGHDGHPRGGFQWKNEDGTTRRATTDELAALQSYPTPGDKWTPTASPIDGRDAIARIKALDLFAGTGWGVACQRLGIKESGVEIMPEAIATREANGMDTIYHDVWDGLQLTAEQHRDAYGSYGLLIASPPCQTFSLAGKGAGRAALDEVLEAIELHAYKDAAALQAFGEKHDPRTALVLTPLAYVWRDRPRLVAMEQVPTVLPVWEACADVMREWGYEVKVQILNAEQYGVPQTRKRAILVARRGGPVNLPTPTHSRYYSSNPSKLDPGVPEWVSMAEALGWRGMTDRPAPTITGGGTETGGAEPIAKYHERYTSAPGWVGSTERVTVEEAAALQSYPVEGWGFTNRPALTVHGHGFVTRSPTGQKQAVITAAEQGEFTFRPPFTAETAGRDDYQPREDGYISMSEMYHADAVNCTPEENAVLQSSEQPFVFCGTKTKQFLQIGNAVPPLLAEHILAALVGIPVVSNR